MLNVYVQGKPLPEGLRYIEDVERLDLYLEGTQAEADLLRVIEQAAPLGRDTIIDRFGYKLYLRDISTGCMAALAVLHYPDLLINMDEAGKNAVAATLAFCRQGNIVIRRPGIELPDVDGETHPIQARVGEYWFDNLDRFSEYFIDEYPYPPELEGGIYHV